MNPRENESKALRFGPREQDLSRHLENGNKSAAPDGPDKPKLLEADTKKLLEKDNQLRMALQMVRGLPKISEIHAQ